jgi:hypothetical protein
MHFGFVNVILLFSDHQHVPATYVAIFKVVVPISPLCILHCHSLIWITIHHIYLICTSLHRTTLQTTVINL